MIKTNRNIIGILITMLGLFLFSAQQAFPLTIHLKNGAYLSGEITTSDEYGFEFKCWGTNGILKLKWQHFDNEERNRLKNTLSLTSLTVRDAYKIEGNKIYLRNGSIYEGTIIEKNATNIKIKTILGVKNAPTADILRSDEIKIDPLKVYTTQEWYTEKAKVFNLGEAADNFELAEYCRLFLKLYEKAKDHYNKSGQLSPSYKERAYQKVIEIDNELIRAKGLEIEKLIANKDPKSLEQARDIITEWKKTSKASPETEKIIIALEERINDTGKLIASKSQKEFIKKISQQYYSTIKLLIKKTCGQELSYQDAVAYINTMIYKQIIEKLSKDNKMSEEDVANMLSDKSPEKYETMPKREASFGEGSWINSAEVQKQPSSMTPEEFAKYQKRIRAVAEAKDKAVLKNELIAPETWWSKANEAQRESFLESVFAERYMYIVEKKETPCIACNGEGVINKNLCKRCWGTMVDIIIIYK